MRIFSIISLVLFCININAQSYKVIGSVKDSIEGPLLAATTVILTKADSVLTGFSITNDNGEFEISDIKAGDYILQITYIGYGTFGKEFTAGGLDKIINLGEFVLQSSNLLETIEIKGELVPIIVKKDTVEYNAAAYKVKPNASVEELLKKLPGMEVDKEGNITSEGENVQQVLVDGKKFFGTDAKMATKNIPADAVKKVKVYDKKSDKAEITGIDDGNETKTIDLELKEDKKSGMFGQLEGGYGTDDRFGTKANVFSFSKNTQLAVIGKYNNLNNTGLSWDEFYTLKSAGGSGGRVSSNGAPINQGENIGDAKSGTGGLNFNYIKSKFTDLNVSYFISGENKLLTQDSEAENFLERGNFFSNNSIFEDTENLRHNFNTEYKTNIDSTKRLTLSGSLNFANSTSDAIAEENNLSSELIALSRNSSANNDENKNLNFSAGMQYTARLNNKGRSWSANSSYSNNNENYINDLFQDLYFYDNDGNLTTNDIINQTEATDQQNDNFNFGLSYTEPLATDLYLSGEIGYSNNGSNRDKLISDIIQNEEPITNDDLSGLFNNDYQSKTAGLSLVKNTENSKYQLGATYQNSNLKGTQNELSPIDRSFNFILPRFSADLDKLNIDIDYTTSVNEPSISQLQPVPDNSNALSLILGNENLVPEYRHRLNIRYFKFDRFNFRSLWANIYGTYTKDKILNTRTIGANLQSISMPINVDYSVNVGGNLSFGTPINPLRIKTRLRVNYSENFGFAFINNAQNKVRNSTTTYSLSIENKNQNVVSAEVYGRLRNSGTNYQNEEISDNSFWVKEYGSEVNIDMGKGWFWDTEFESNIYSKEQYGDDNVLNFWDMSLAKQFMDGQFEVKVLVHDLLNQNTGLSRSVTDLYINETRSNAIGRYTMLNLVYKLSQFNPTSGRHRMK
jgi:hypothetical protein